VITIEGVNHYCAAYPDEQCTEENYLKLRDDCYLDHGEVGKAALEKYLVLQLGSAAQDKPTQLVGNIEIINFDEASVPKMAVLKLDSCAEAFVSSYQDRKVPCLGGGFLQFLNKRPQPESSTRGRGRGKGRERGPRARGRGRWANVTEVRNSGLTKAELLAYAASMED
jgi:hypothetical protein